MSNGAHENYNNCMQLSRVNIVLYIVINERSPELKAKLACHIFDVFGFNTILRRGFVENFWGGNLSSMCRNILSGEKNVICKKYGTKLCKMINSN